MLSDERIDTIKDCVDWSTGWAYQEFARAIESEATAPMIEQIKEDEALMARALTSLDDYEAGAEIGKFDIQIIKALRQRLEDKK